MTTPSLITRLAILQQAEYELPRYHAWRMAHPESEEIAPQKWTLKLRLLFAWATLIGPLTGIDPALSSGLFLLALPTRLFIAILRMLATLKLRYAQSRGLTVIAIAGSYGKTTTKYALNHVLSEKFPTLMTPENINTPIGIARVILQDLDDTHKIFLVEMGEYYRGDIADLTRFVRPALKVLTPIGFAHLERFGSSENLTQGLLELLTTTPHTPAYVHAHNTAALPNTTGSDVTIYGDALITATTVRRGGTDFTLTFDGNTYEGYTQLLGQHNVVNTLPALLIAHRLGVPLPQAIAKLYSLLPVAHRLEPTLLEQGILLLDNGYNSNPQAARESLTVLNKIEGSQKIVITPGFIEMGAQQEEANTTFGTQLAEVADIVVIIRGVNTQALQHGLTQAHFPKSHLYTARSEQDAMTQIQALVKPHAVILFENSIPQLYTR